MKNYFLTIDTETTQDGLVADFAAVITDKKGNIVNQCAVMVAGVYDDETDHPLFHIHGDAGDLWSKAGLPKRYDRYNRMLANGTRMLASVPAVNAWLAKARIAYNPYLTAYNLAFDLDKCENTAIDLTIFERRFCLWQAAFAAWGTSKRYRQFVLDTHAFNAPTGQRNMSYKTNAETMARFVLGNPELEDEPHTALEDVIDYEIPILNALLKRSSVRKIVDSCEPYNWHKTQVKDWFTAK